MFLKFEGENFINNLRATKLLKWLPFTVLILRQRFRLTEINIENYYCCFANKQTINHILISTLRESFLGKLFDICCGFSQNINEA